MPKIAGRDAITVKVHFLFIVFILAMWLRAATGKGWVEGSGLAMLVLLALIMALVMAIVGAIRT